MASICTANTNIRRTTAERHIQDERSRGPNTLSNLYIKHMLGVLVLGRIMTFTPRQFFG